MKTWKRIEERNEPISEDSRNIIKPIERDRSDVYGDMIMLNSFKEIDFEVS